MIPTRISTPNYSARLDAMGLRPQRLALGTAALGGAWGPVDTRESVDALLHALDQGVTVLDTAPAYHMAETYVAQALREWTGSRPLVSTKVGRLHSEAADIGRYDYSYEAMYLSAERSRELFRVDVLDLVFLHDPDEVPPADRSRVVEALWRLKADGLINRVGFGGNPDTDWLRYLASGLFDVVMGFNRVDACNLDAFSGELPVYQLNQLAFYAGSPLHMGLLGRRLTAYATQRPDWISSRDVAVAQAVSALAHQWDMSLPTLAQRYVLSIAEVDRVVFGPRHQADIRQMLADVQAGLLPQELFDQLTATILNINDYPTH